MANQHTQALETRAAELAKEQHAINYEVARLERLIENPVCGKPGAGYKAAAKAKKQLAALQPRVDAFSAAYHDYLYSGKASFKTRQQRADTYWKVFMDQMYSIDNWQESASVVFHDVEYAPMTDKDIKQSHSRLLKRTRITPIIS